MTNWHLIYLSLVLQIQIQNINNYNQNIFHRWAEDPASWKYPWDLNLSLNKTIPSWQ